MWSTERPPTAVCGAGSYSAANSASCTSTLAFRRVQGGFAADVTRADDHCRAVWAAVDGAHPASFQRVRPIPTTRRPVRVRARPVPPTRSRLAQVRSTRRSASAMSAIPAPMAAHARVRSRTRATPGLFPPSRPASMRCSGCERGGAPLTGRAYPCAPLAFLPNLPGGRPTTANTPAHAHPHTHVRGRSLHDRLHEVGDRRGGLRRYGRWPWRAHWMRARKRRAVR